MSRAVLVARLDNAGDVLLTGRAIRAVAAHADSVVVLAGPHGRAAAALLPRVDAIIEWRAPFRWTSLGLSLIEAMQLGLPVVALATTEAVEAVPAGAGVVSTRIDVLAAAVRGLLSDPDRARETGAAGRAAARERYGLERFLREGDSVLQEVSR